MLLDAMEGLERRFCPAAQAASERGCADPDVDQLRGWAGQLIHELYEPRQRGADLVYEAYGTDIGGET